MALPHFVITTGVYFILLIPLLIHICRIKSKPKGWYKKGVKIENNNPQLLRFLYAEAQKMLIHYDELNWRIGSIVIDFRL